MKSSSFIFRLLPAAILCGPAAAELPPLVIPQNFGVNIHFYAAPEQDMGLIEAAGIRVIRQDLGWSNVERERGVYRFDNAGYDALTEDCKTRGIQLLYILDYSNNLYESDRSVRTAEGRTAFTNYARAAAQRYAGNSILWEIWNEPNISLFWRPEPNVDDYCSLVQAAAPAVREADSNGLVVAPATSTIDMNWLEACFQKGLLNWIDAVTVHPYRPSNPETVIEEYARLRTLINEYAPQGKTIEILSGEWGYSNINWDNNSLSDEKQAQYLAREFLINLSEGIHVSIWYDWKNDGSDPNEREHNFGMTEQDLTPKDAYNAAKTLYQTLDGFSIRERIDIGSGDDYVFELANGLEKAAAFWTSGDAHTITLTLEANTGTLTDMLGNTSAASWDAGGLEVTVSQSPQYLVYQDQTDIRNRMRYSRRLKESHSLVFKGQNIRLSRIPEYCQKILIFDISGNKVCEIPVSAGYAVWNGRGTDDITLDNGIYYIQYLNRGW